jgi:hypothetical protein
MGMNNDYAIDANTDSNGINKFIDASWNAQKGVYPACTLTFDFVWSGQSQEYGDLKIGSPPNTAGSYGAVGPTIAWVVGDGLGTDQPFATGDTLIMGQGTPFPDGIPYSGTGTGDVSIQTDTAGVETVPYTSLVENTVTNTYTITLGTVPTASTVADGSSATFPETLNPDTSLNPDQERTLYSYFTYMFSDAAQGSFAAAGYRQLPEGEINTLRAAFQAEF